MGTWGPPHPRRPTPWAPGHPCFLGSQSTSHVKTPGQVWGRGHQVGPSLLTHIAPLCTPTGPPEWGPAPQPAPTCIRFCASGFTAPHAAVPRRHPCPEARLPVCCCSVLPGLSCSRVPPPSSLPLCHPEGPPLLPAWCSQSPMAADVLSWAGRPSGWVVEAAGSGVQDTWKPWAGPLTLPGLLLTVKCWRSRRRLHIAGGLREDAALFLQSQPLPLTS